MFNIDYAIFTAPMRDLNSPMLPTNRQIHYSILMHTFILLNLFNMFNCRTLATNNSRGLNILTGLHRHTSFIVVIASILFLQYSLFFNKSAGYLFGTTSMTSEMHFVALGLGFGSILLAGAVKLTPTRLTAVFNSFCGVQKVTKLDSSLQLQKNIDQGLLAENEPASPKTV